MPKEMLETFLKKVEEDLAENLEQIQEVTSPELVKKVHNRIFIAVTRRNALRYCLDLIAEEVSLNVLMDRILEIILNNSNDPFQDTKNPWQDKMTITVWTQILQRLQKKAESQQKNGSYFQNSKDL